MPARGSDDLFAATSLAAISAAFVAYVARAEWTRRRALRLARRAGEKFGATRTFAVRHVTEKGWRAGAGLASSIGILFASKERLVYAYRRLRWLESSSYATSGDADLLEIPIEGLTITRAEGGKVSWLALAANGRTNYFRIDRVLVFGSERLANELERDLKTILGQPVPLDPLTVPPEQGGPVHVVRRREPVEIWRLSFLSVWAILAATCMAGLAWLRDAFPTSVFHERHQLLGAGAFVMTGTLLYLARRFLAARGGQVALYEDRIELERGALSTVSWTELAGYRDGSIDFVQLVRKGETLPASDLAIPTASESDRTAVLALLDRKGLRRLDA